MGMDRWIILEFQSDMPWLMNFKLPLRHVLGFPLNPDNKCMRFSARGCWLDIACSDWSAFVCGMPEILQPPTTSTVLISTTIQSTLSTTTTNGNALYAQYE